MPGATSASKVGTEKLNPILKQLLIGAVKIEDAVYDLDYLVVQHLNHLHIVLSSINEYCLIDENCPLRDLKIIALVLLRWGVSKLVEIFIHELHEPPLKRLRDELVRLSQLFNTRGQKIVS